MKPSIVVPLTRDQVKGEALLGPHLTWRVLDVLDRHDAIQEQLARAHLDTAVEKETVHQLRGEVAMLREALARMTEQHRRVQDLLTQAESDRDFARAEFQIANQQLARALLDIAAEKKICAASRLAAFKLEKQVADLKAVMPTPMKPAETRRHLRRQVDEMQSTRDAALRRIAELEQEVGVLRTGVKGGYG